MGDVTLKLEPCDKAGKPSGTVAYLRMPIALSAMKALGLFIEKAYGADCVCGEDPKGWLTVKRKPMNEEK